MCRNVSNRRVYPQGGESLAQQWNGWWERSTLRSMPPLPTLTLTSSSSPHLWAHGRASLSDARTIAQQWNGKVVTRDGNSFVSNSPDSRIIGSREALFPPDSRVIGSREAINPPDTRVIGSWEAIKHPGYTLGSWEAINHPGYTLGE